MNTRIFELAELALEETHRVMGSTSLQEAFDDFYTEKFAELIVRECIIVINQPNGVGDDDVIRISQDVKIHFGVEE